MPIYLPPISRRTFLKRSASTAAGLLLGPNLFAAGQRPKASTWAMLADPHISANPEQLGRGVNMTDHLRQVCHEIVELETAPAGVIVHGDCAFSSGRLGDYEQLLRLLGPVREHRLPIHLALGNHDHRQRFLAAVEARTPSGLPDKYVSILKSGRVNFFLLDSLDKTLSKPGVLGAEQVRWLAEGLEANAEKPAVVCVHHNPPKLGDFEQLLSVLEPCPHVKAMFYGHRHSWGLDRTPGGIHLVNLLPVSYPARDEQLTGASGWVQATFADDGARLEVRCLQREHSLHGSVHQLKWR